MTTVDKLWGRENWLTNNRNYCVKLLYLNPGFESSLHYHNVKDEMFVVVEGEVELDVVGIQGTLVTLHLKPYQSYRLFPGRRHRFRAVNGPAVIVEASTHHRDEDVVRIEESRRIEQ